MRQLQTVLMLAGGNSDRFWPLKNKNYWQFLGKTGIEWQIENYARIAEKIILVENKENQEQINRLINSLGKMLTAKLTVVFQKDDLAGQAGAILSAQDQLSGEVLIVNANDFYKTEDLDQFVKQVIQKQPDLFFLVNKVKDYFPGGYLKFSQDRLIEIVEKPDQDHLPSDMVKLVVDYIKNIKLLIDFLKEVKTNQDNHYELGLNRYIAQSAKNDYLICDDHWSSLKYPWQVLSLMRLFLKTLPDNCVGHNVKISPTAKIVGPCYIGDNTVVGDYSLVVNSHIGANCLIGGYCEVTRSYLGNSVMLHRNYIGDSVLADGVLLGAGAVTANYRFDQSTVNSFIKDKKIATQMTKLGAIIGKNSKVGVNSTLFPGVKIGSHSLIAPASIINHDLEDDLYFSQGNKTINKLS